MADGYLVCESLSAGAGQGQLVLSAGSRVSLSMGSSISISRSGRTPSSVNLRAPGSTWRSSEPTAALK